MTVRPDRRVRLHVRGRVQGVWFRGATRRRALELGVRGWARNLPDGSVEVLAQGDPGGIEALVEWCNVGPDAARVDSVSRQDESPADDLEGFDIR